MTTTFETILNLLATPQAFAAWLQAKGESAVATVGNAANHPIGNFIQDKAGISTDFFLDWGIETPDGYIGRHQLPDWVTQFEDHYFMSDTEGFEVKASVVNKLLNESLNARN